MSDTLRDTAAEAPGLTPPQALDAERSILAAMMLDAGAIGRAVEMIDARVFYRSAHGKIFDALVSLFNRNEPADLITVSEELKRRGDYESVGGAPALAQIMDHATTAANLEHHARIVHSKSVLRELIKASTEIQQQCYGGHEETAILLDQAEARIFGITDQRIRQGFSSIRDLLKPAFDNIQKLFERKVQVTGVPTGWDDLDKLTSGWQPGDLVILAGRPAMGKCVSWRTLVVDPDTGERITAEECVLRRMPNVLGIDEAGVVRRTPVSAWIDSGIKPCFRVTTRLGRSIEVTGHHPFLTTDGWTPLHDLKVGDAIGVPSIMPVAGTDTSWPLTRVRLLAYLIAEGGLSSDTPHFTTADPVLRRTCGSELAAMRADPSRASIPSVVWSWDRERLSEFVSALFEVSLKSHESNVTIGSRLQTSSHRLTVDVQHALLRLGLVAEIARSDAGRWIVTVQDREQADCRDWTSELRRANRADSDGVVNAEALALADPVMMGVASEDLYWDPIIEITPVGEMQVYDLTVPDGANFIANDICVHNTSCVMNMAENAAIKYSIPVAVFSLEMSKEQLALRLLCSQSEVPLHKVRTGYLGNEDWPRLTTGAGLLTAAPIFIDDSPAQSVLEIRAKCRRLKAENKLGLIVIDYLQLMRASTHAENRVQEISQISRGLKALAKELSVPIIALSQLSRAVEQRGGSGRPQLSDLRESGSIEQDADVVMFVYREVIYKPDTPEPGKAQIIIAKQRNGPTDDVDMTFIRDCTKFVPYSPLTPGDTEQSY